jgi:hypothetical protein
MRRVAPVSLCAGLLAFVATALVGCGATKDVGGPDDLSPDAGGPGTDTGGGCTSGFCVDASTEGGDPDSELTLQDLQLEPANATVYIDTATSPATPATVTYKGTITDSTGATKDVSTSMTMSLDDPALGAFAANTFTSIKALPGTALGVTTVVHGTAEGKNGSANLTIVQLRRTGDKRDFFFLEPYLGSPSPDRDVLKFGTNIKQVDVAFSFDTTGSMGGSITNLKTNLSTTVMPALLKAIPSVGLGVVDFKDIGDTWTVKVTQLITTDLAKAQAAANALAAGGGGDEPEADIQSMYHILTGEAVSALAKHTPAAGTFGGVDFRPGSLPVVVNVTDAHWHDPSGSVTSASLTAAFGKANAKFVQITVNYGISDMENLANNMSDATKSSVPPSAFGAGCAAGQCCSGEGGAARAPTGPGGTCRLNFLAKSDGSGVGAGIVAAIQAISVGSQFDVTAVASNDPTNADGVDATKFIKALRAMDEGDAAQGCPAHAAKDTNADGIKDTFIAVVVGTPVCFEILPKMNETVPPKSVAQFFNAFIDVLGMPGSVKLDKRTVLFEVPPKAIAAK